MLLHHDGKLHRNAFLCAREITESASGWKSNLIKSVLCDGYYYETRATSHTSGFRLQIHRLVRSSEIFREIESRIYRCSYLDWSRVPNEKVWNSLVIFFFFFFLRYVCMIRDSVKSAKLGGFARKFIKAELRAHCNHTDLCTVIL